MFASIDRPFSGPPRSASIGSRLERRSSSRAHRSPFAQLINRADGCHRGRWSARARSDFWMSQPIVGGGTVAVGPPVPVAKQSRRPGGPLRRQGATSRPRSMVALEDRTSHGSPASWSRRACPPVPSPDLLRAESTLFSERRRPGARSVLHPASSHSSATLTNCRQSAERAGVTASSDRRPRQDAERGLCQDPSRGVRPAAGSRVEHAFSNFQRRSRTGWTPQCVP